MPPSGGAGRALLMSDGNSKRDDRTGVVADWASAAKGYVRGDLDLFDTWWAILERDRESYHAACTIPTHPLHLVHSFFTQLSAAERHRQVPIDPAWMTQWDFELYTAFSQLARAEQTPLDSLGASTRFLYAADLHGDRRAYAALPDLCSKHGLNMIVLGGDMLPKGRTMLEAQLDFLSRELAECLDRCASMGIAFFGLFGNDDLRAVHDTWMTLAHSRRGVYDLAERWYMLPGGFQIRGSSWVPDYPFGLKDWCLRDRLDAKPVPTHGRSIVTTRDGITVIDDPVAFFASRPTMEEQLESLVGPKDTMDRAVLVSHAPPANLGLGMLMNGEDVGSQGLRSWITRRQPLLTLSGHIHESPYVSLASHGEPRHTAMLGRTTCHQPGQVLPEELNYSIVDLDPDGTVRIDWRQMQLSR